jgi:hypothetical protein
LPSAASPVSILRSIFCALRRPRFARNALARRRRSAALRELAALDKTGFAPSGTGRSLEPDKLMIFVFQRASPNSPRLPRKDGVKAAEGRAESLVERHGSQGKARVCGVLRRMDSNLGGQARRNGKGGTGSCNARGSRKFETAVIRKKSLYNIKRLSLACQTAANNPGEVSASGLARVAIPPHNPSRILTSRRTFKANYGLRARKNEDEAFGSKICGS